MSAGVLNFTQQIAASGFLANLFETQPGAQIFRQLPRRAYVSIWAVQDGAGPAAPYAPLLGQLTVGNIIRVPESAGRIQTFTAGQGPIKRDHLWWDGAIEALSQLILSCRNTDAANASNLRAIVEYNWQ